MLDVIRGMCCCVYQDISTWWTLNEPESVGSVGTRPCKLHLAREYRWSLPLCPHAALSARCVHSASHPVKIVCHGIMAWDSVNVIDMPHMDIIQHLFSEIASWKKLPLDSDSNNHFRSAKQLAWISCPALMPKVNTASPQGQCVRQRKQGSCGSTSTTPHIYNKGSIPRICRMQQGFQCLVHVQFQ